jgi:hypothetical protein
LREETGFLSDALIVTLMIDSKALNNAIRLVYINTQPFQAIDEIKRCQNRCFFDTRN